MRIARGISAALSALILVSVIVVIYISYAAQLDHKRNFYFSGTKPALERRKLWGNSSNCKSMFSLLDGDDNSSLDIPHDIKRIIVRLKHDLKNDDVWDWEPYEKISLHLSSAIRKKFRAFESAPFNDTLMGMECGKLLHFSEIADVVNISYEEVSMAKLCMLWKQKHFTYQLNQGKNILMKYNGKLPYLNCRMNYKFSPKETLRCFRNAVHKKNASVLIEFIGDSKINQVFEAFLVETKEIDYEIIITGKERTSQKYSLWDWLVQALRRRNRQQVEATVRSAPGFTVRMHFASFDEINDEEILQSDIYKKLLSWALGEEPPPDLIIIGYGTWMMLVEFHRKEFRPPLTLLHNQWDIHTAVLRMLLNMKDTTRVLFLSQNMQKPHAYKEKEPAPVEERSRIPWINFSNLGWLNLREKLTTFYAPYAGRNKSDFWGAVFARRGNAFSFLPKSISFRDRFRILMEELPSVSKESHSSQHKSLSDPEGHAGIWFWDSTQPVAFASLRDCDTLYHHDPMSTCIIPYTYNIDPKTTHI
ncbi:uncharacterized protein LOC125179213 [Hyalella azteca]|uniref:Uncharacterized protein LOC125179213 n=1 Tax=Hyalella azteca TaxID=294128 RepID=A0A979FVN4_HYAAZ|nr:uncharacterized protein LOC125179213 [Hyalella azteca]